MRVGLGLSLIHIYGCAEGFVKGEQRSGLTLQRARKVSAAFPAVLVQMIHDAAEGPGGGLPIHDSLGPLVHDGQGRGQ